MKIYNLLRWIPALIVMGVIFYLSSQPHLNRLDPLGLLTWDKAVHMFAYFVLSACLWYPLLRTKTPELNTFAVSFLYGASDEYHQSFVHGRSCDAADLLADAVGTIVLIISVYIVGRIKHGRKQRSNSK